MHWHFFRFCLILARARLFFLLEAVFGEVHAELICRLADPVLVHGLDTLGGQPEPDPSLAFHPENTPLLKVNVLDLHVTIGENKKKKKKTNMYKPVM